MEKHPLPLLCHPSCVPPSGCDVEAVIAVAGERLCVDYHGSMPAETLRLPAPGGAGQADGLWRHSCCELFVACRGTTAYREFNFALSGQWAAYEFAGYRQRTPWLPLAAPTLTATRHATQWRLRVELPISLLPASVDRLELSVTAVLEAADASLSYWALHHPAAAADFHDRRGFVLPLEAPCGVGEKAC